MILDRGPMAVFERVDITEPGGRPRYETKLKSRSLFARLEFSTSPARPTPGREEIQVDARIRIHQNPAIRRGDRVVLADAETLEDVPEGTPIFEVERAFHGTDDDSGQPITDLSLKAVSGWNFPTSGR